MSADRRRKPLIHPWTDFVAARLAVIGWLVAEGKTDAQIRAAINVDADQLTRLKWADQMLVPTPPQSS